MLLKEGKLYRENTESDHAEEILNLKKSSAAQIATLNARIQELEHEIKMCVSATRLCSPLCVYAVSRRRPSVCFVLCALFKINKSDVYVLRRIEEFKREKHNMVDEIESYKKSLLREQESRKVELADQERRNVQTKNRMNREFEERFKQLEAVSAENARKQLNRKTKMIFIDNEKMVGAHTGNRKTPPARR